MKTKIKEQENSISELSSAVESFLKIQAIVKKLLIELLEDIEAIVPQERFKVTVSMIDPKIVKPFTPRLRKSVGMTKRQIFMKERQDSAELCLKELTDSCNLSRSLLCEQFRTDQRKTMDLWGSQTDNMKSGAPGKKSQYSDISADTI